MVCVRRRGGRGGDVRWVVGECVVFVYVWKKIRRGAYRLPLLRRRLIPWSTCRRNEEMRCQMQVKSAPLLCGARKAAGGSHPKTTHGARLFNANLPGGRHRRSGGPSPAPSRPARRAPRSPPPPSGSRCPGPWSKLLSVGMGCGGKGRRSGSIEIEMEGSVRVLDERAPVDFERGGLGSSVDGHMGMHAGVQSASRR